MKFSTLAIDDEPYVLKDLLQTIKLVPAIDLKASFHSATDALSYLDRYGPVNIILSDIEMPDLSGIEGGELLANQCDLLVFTTAYAQFTKEAFGVGAKGYILKPVRTVDLLKVTTSLKKMKTSLLSTSSSLPEYLMVRTMTDNAMRKIALTSVLCLTSFDNYVRIATKEQDYIRYGTLLKLEKQLSKTNCFIRISRSVIISLAAISSVNKEVVRLSNGTEHRISRLRKAEFLRVFDEQYINI